MTEYQSGAAAERAQQWHDEQVKSHPDHEQFSSCWCCCWTCDPDAHEPGSSAGNPHWDAARQEEQLSAE